MMGINQSHGPRLSGEEDFIACAKNNSEDTEAFSRLLRHYEAYVYAIINNVFNTYKHERQCLSDVAQDVWFKAWRSLNNFQYRGAGSFQSWVGVIARNTSISHVQECEIGGGEPLPGENAFGSNARENSDSAPIHHLPPVKAPFRSEIKIHTERHYDQLGSRVTGEIWEHVLQALYEPNQHFGAENQIEVQQACILYFLFELTQREIRDMIGCSIGRVNNLLQEGRCAISRYLQNKGIRATYFDEGLHSDIPSEAPGEAKNAEQPDLTMRPNTPDMLRHRVVWYAFTECLGKLREEKQDESYSIRQKAALSHWILRFPVESTAKMLGIEETAAANTIITATISIRECLDKKGHKAASYGF